MALNRITLARFNALAAHSRSPAAAFVSRELDWFSNDDETLIATLMLDTVDDDFVGIVLGRDEGGRFRCIDVESGLPTADEAVAWIERAIGWHGRDGQGVFPQGQTSKPLDLFTPIAVAIEATIVGRRADRPASYFRTASSLPEDQAEVLCWSYGCGGAGPNWQADSRRK